MPSSPSSDAAHTRLALSPASIERRRFERAPTRGTATAVVESRNGGTSIAGVSLLDSSPAGLGLVSMAPLPIGERVRIHFGGQPTAGRQGRVARCVEITLAPEEPDAEPATGWLIGVDESRRDRSALPLAG